MSRLHFWGGKINMQFKKCEKVLILAYLLFHFMDFMSTFYAIYVNNPNGVIEEKNMFIKDIVESSPLNFTIYYIFSNAFFMAIVLIAKKFEEITKLSVLNTTLILTIIVKCVALINNFYILIILMRQ